MKKLVIYANPTYDVIEGVVRVGGPGLYAVRGARIHGYEVAVYGAVGRDGHRAILEYRRVGVRFEKLVFNVDEFTTRFRIEYDGDRRRMVVEEPGPLITYVEERHPRVVSPVLGELPSSVLRRLVRGAYLDVQGVVRRRSRGPLQLVEGACRSVLDEDALPRAIHGDIDELRVCLGSGALEQLRSLTASGVEVLASMGYRGLILAYDEKVYRVYAWGPRSPNPTGMGDVLLAAYAAGRESGLDPLEAVKHAVVACGLWAEGREPSGDDVERHVGEVRIENVTWSDVEALLG